MKFRKTNKKRKTIRNMKKRTIRNRKTNRNKKMIGGDTPLSQEQKTYLINMQFDLPSGINSFPDRIKEQISADTRTTVENINPMCRMNDLTDLATLMATYPQGTVIPAPYSNIYIVLATFFNGYSTSANVKSKLGKKNP